MRMQLRESGVPFQPQPASRSGASRRGRTSARARPWPAPQAAHHSALALTVPRFRRAAPAAAGTRYLDPAAGVPLLDLAAATTLDQLQPEAVLRAAAGRNITLSADVGAGLWRPEAGYSLRSPTAAAGTAAAGFGAIGGAARTFDVEIRLRIPPQPVW